MKNQESIELDESREHVDFCGSFANYGFSMFPGSSRDFCFNVRKNPAYSLSSRERNQNEQTVRNTWYQSWNCRTVEGSSGKTGTSSSGVEELSNKLFALFRFFLSFHSLRSLSFVPLCRGWAEPMLERFVYYRSLLSACSMARGNRFSSSKLKDTIPN